MTTEERQRLAKNGAMNEGQLVKLGTLIIAQEQPGASEDASRAPR